MLLTTCVLTQAAEPGIVQITELVRHGARNNIKSILGTKFPADIEPSRLTPNGHRQHYNLGVTLRKKYPEIFGTKTTTQQINLYSSPVHRCQQSAASQLMGLFPTGLYDVNISVAPESPMVLADFEGTQNELAGNPALPNAYAPFPLIVNTDYIDNLFMPVEEACPVMFKTMVETRQKLSAKNADLITAVSDMLAQAGYDPKKLVSKDSFSADDINWIFDETYAYRNFYDKLPDNITQEIYDKMEKLASIHFIAMFGEGAQLSKIHSHQMALEILGGMKQWTDGKIQTPAKFRLFSGHDTNILGWAAGLGLGSFECLTDIARGKTPTVPCFSIPKFASSFIFELRKSSDTQEFFVKPLLNGKVVEICPSQKESPQKLCKFAEFESIIKQKLTWGGDDYLAQCGNKMLIAQKSGSSTPVTPETPKPEMSLVGKIALVSCVILALAVFVLCMFPQKVIPSLKGQATDSETSAYTMRT